MEFYPELTRVSKLEMWELGMIAVYIMHKYNHTPG